MSQEIPNRWKDRVRRHLLATTGEARESLGAHDFPIGRSVRLDFPDGSFVLFRHAFHLEDGALCKVAVFTEHCGYHFFPAGELHVEVLDAVWTGAEAEGE